jgi:glycosyltransferase involved in cell wall biosynthesis
MTDASASGMPGRVAVIIPTYNHAHVLDEAIGSVLAQSIEATEVIVVDDGSTDRPEAVVARHTGVRLLRQSNRGLAAARNSGWRASVSPYLMFLDADDRLRPDAIEVSLRCIGQDPLAAFCYGAYANVFMPSGRVSIVPFRPVPKDAFAAFLRVNTIGMHGTVMYRRGPLEAAGGFREALRACEDYDLYLRLSMLHPVLCGPHLIADYLQHDSNMSRDPAFMLKSVLKVLRQFRGEARDRGLLADYRIGIRGWQEYYVDGWAGVMMARGLTPSTLRQSMTVARLAPRAMLKKIVIRLLDWARSRRR